MKIKFLLVFAVFCLLQPAQFLSAEDFPPEPYGKDEFHPVLKDLRRAEIITLGAIPFVTFNVTLGYSFSKYASHNFDSNYFPNPFAKGSDANAFTTDEQIGIILTSLGISAGIGLTDFIVHAVKRSRARKRLQTQQAGPIKITPVSEDPEAVRIEIAPEANADGDFSSRDGNAAPPAPEEN
ncbi:MAG: hypothetical protein ACTTKL_11230 [Treponema sp.]